MKWQKSSRKKVAASCLASDCYGPVGSEDGVDCVKSSLLTFWRRLLTLLA